jgi:hypothetical protein
MSVRHKSEITSTDLLAEAVDQVRPLLMDTKRPTKERVHVLWSAAKAARNLSSSDVIQNTFTKLAVDVGLIDSAGRWTGNDVRDWVQRYGKEDIAHVVTWALRGWNPFEKGPLT